MFPINPNGPRGKFARARGGNFTPQQKIQSIADKIGVPGLMKQQGTTVVRYDSLPFDGRTQYNFFFESQNRPFPLSNSTSDGGKLGVGESMIIQRITLAVVTMSAGTTTISSIDPITKGLAGIIDGEITISAANNNVLLRLPIAQFLPEFNKNAENALNTSYEFDTLLMIPPQVDYQIGLRVSGVTTADKYLRCTIEGVGSILNLRTTL